MAGDTLTDATGDPLAAVLAEARHVADAGDAARARALVDTACADHGDRPELLALRAQLERATGYPAAAIATLEQLAVVAPLDADQHAALGFDLLAAHDPARAEPHLRAAFNAAPGNVVLRTALAESLVQLGRSRDALGIALPVLRRGDAGAPLWQAGLTAARLLERSQLSLLLERRAARQAPADRAVLIVVARSLLDRGAGAAAFALLAPLTDDPADRDYAELSFLCSVALAQDKRFEAAFVAIEQAISHAPDQRAYLLHAVAVLGQLGRHGRAAEFLDGLTNTDHDGPTTPADEAWLRAIFATYTEAGRYESAIAVGAQLVQLVPDDIDFLSVYETVIGKHLYARLISSKPVERPTVKRAERAPTRGRIRPPSFQRSVSALFRREMKTRFGRSRLGYLWVLFEPLAHIGIMIFLIGLLNHGGLPPIGQSFAVFYFTGIIPYHLFTHTTGHLIGSVPENRPLLQIPRVRILDIFAARALLEAVTELIVAMIFLAAFLATGIDAMPLEPLAVLGALLLLWVAAIGVGMISAAIVSVFPAWERIWGAAASVIYFTSGTFYVPRMMPIWIRDILVWNPVLQGIELVRFHYFHEPAPEWLSISYLVGFAVGAVAIALVLERLMRRRMLDIE